MKKKLLAAVTTIALVAAMIPGMAFAEDSAGDISIPVEKIWSDSDNAKDTRTDSVTISLIADGSVIDTVTLNEENEWNGAFEVNKADLIGDGAAKELVLEEENVPDGYAADYDNPATVYTPFSVTGAAGWARVTPNNMMEFENGYNMVVTKDGNKIYVWTSEELTGEEQAAVQAEAEKRSEIKGGSFTYEFFYGEGAKVAGVTVSTEKISFDAKNAWSMFFKGSYTPEAIDVSECSVTNKLETIDISGQKYWEDNDDEYGARPESISIHLHAANSDVSDIDKIVTEADGWAYTFEDVDAYDEDGNIIEYIIVEDAVENYSLTCEGEYDLINTYEPSEEPEEPVIDPEDPDNPVVDPDDPEDTPDEDVTEDEPVKTPKTGDDTGIMALWAIMMTALAGLGTTVAVRRRMN